ncbi:MAG: prepilin-type N-terminal cleavage/methylation domain-containing protein [Desulfamplus sp.]|nr:prepilin-type N-terminal cleavage/methylation domain-containing protein [Desulfamplus sp.]
MKMTMDETKGFTLLEIMVAVMIFGILMITIFSSFRTFMDSSRMVDDHISRTRNFDILINRIVTDIEALRISLPPEYRKPGQPSPAPGTLSSPGESPFENGDPFALWSSREFVNGKVFSTLSFASLSGITFGEDTRTGAARIFYHVRPGTGSSLDLCRFDDIVHHYLRGSAPSNCDPVIFRDVKEFSITFRHRDGTEHDRWDSQSDDFDFTTPVSIHLTISDQTHTFETRIPMPLFRGK